MGIKININLSQGSITFLFFSGFGLGVVITAVVLLGSQIPLKCFDAGSAADWFAAVGTWVIGAGAMKIAYDANVKRKLEVDVENKAKLKAREVALRLIAAEASTAQLFERNLKEEFDAAGNVDYPGLRFFFEITLKKLGPIRWDSAQKSNLQLDEDTLKVMERTEHCLLAVMDYCERFLSQYPENLRSFNPKKSQLLRWMKEAASDLTRASEELERAVRKELLGEGAIANQDVHA